MESQGDSSGGGAWTPPDCASHNTNLDDCTEANGCQVDGTGSCVPLPSGGGMGGQDQGGGDTMGGTDPNQGGSGTDPNQGGGGTDPNQGGGGMGGGMGGGGEAGR